MTDGTTWRVIVIGGGPAAALQVRRLIDDHVPVADILVVGRQWGAPGMSFLGDTRLQSYVHELDLEGTGHPAMTASGFVQPTGSEYDDYVRRVLTDSGATLLEGEVVDLFRSCSLREYTVRVRTSQNVRTLHAGMVVLATGTRPQLPADRFRAVGAITYDDVYRTLLTHRGGLPQDRPAVVVGSGNSAMQTAALLASNGRPVTVLARRYLGMYPTETSDRYAWRAPSQLTWELVVKSTHDERCCDGVGVCVRFLVYDTIDVLHGDSLRVRVRTEDNQHQMGRHSAPRLHSHVKARPTVDGWDEQVPTPLIVWATGCTPVYPPSALLDRLPKDEDGYLLSDQFGQTQSSGLYVTGSCSGNRSVNEMTPAVPFDLRAVVA